MLSRRLALKGSLAACGSGLVTWPFGARAQRKGPVKVRYQEVVRSILYAPAYVAIAKGFFKEAGIEVNMTIANGGDKAMAALLGDRADIGLMGPDIPIYVMTSDSAVKSRIFCGLTATDGFMLVGREPVPKFDWQMLRGKEILGWRPGGTPLLFLEAALRKNGLDPRKDVKLNNNVGFAARVGAWLAGQNQYAIFIEPEATQLELDGKAHFLVSIGDTVGPADYTAFAATDKYIRENPDVVQNWTNAVYKGMRWTASAPISEIVDTIEAFFPGVGRQVLTTAAERYRRMHIWKSSPMITQEALDRFQEILVEGHVLEPNKRVRYQDLVLTEFAQKAQ